jgi:transcriptional regulator with XRE-family HTH domain
MKQFENIGEKLKALRKRDKLTLKDIAKYTGLSTAFLSDIERGRTDPSLKTLVKLANAHGTTVSQLLSDIL